MATATFNSIDPNQIATQRQVYGVACHFANIASKTPTERYGLTKVFNAILNKHYKDSDSYMTHGEATEWFEWDCVPPQFMSLIKKPKASKVKKTAKTVKKSTPKGKATDRVDTLEKRVDAMDTKLEKILEILSK